MKYSDKLKDPRWQKKRLEIFERDGWACTLCGDSEQTLHIHHLCYQKGKDPWEYEDKHLLTLCANCHEEETATRYMVERSLCFELAGKGFMTSDIISLSEGFNLLTIIMAPEVTASIINFAFKTPKIMGLLSDLFFEDLDRRCEEDKKTEDKK